MKNRFKLHAPLLSVVLSLLAVGYTFANNVVVIPLAADTGQTRWALIDGVNNSIIRQSGGISLVKSSVGQYYVNFGVDVTGNALITTSRGGHLNVWSAYCGNNIATNDAETIKCASSYNTTNFAQVTSTTYVAGTGQLLSDAVIYVAVLP